MVNVPRNITGRQIAGEFLYGGQRPLASGPATRSVTQMLEERLKDMVERLLYVCRLGMKPGVLHVAYSAPLEGVDAAAEVSVCAGLMEWIDVLLDYT